MLLSFMALIVGALIKKEDEDLGFKIVMIGFGIFLICFIIARILKWHK